MALALGSCGSSGNDGSSSGSGAGGGATTGGTTGGSGSSEAAGSSGSTGGSDGFTPATISFSWSTYKLLGTTRTPLTCSDIGAGTVGFTLSGDSLESAENWYSSNGEFCASGDYPTYRWEHGPGDFYLTITLYTGLASDNNRNALISGVVGFTVPEGAAHVDVPEVKLARIMFPLSWSIEKAGTAATCADVGATEVDFLLAEIRENFESTISWSEPCSATPNETISTPGNYQLTATLKGSSGALASWTAPEQLVFSKESAAIPPPIMFEVP
ncbi:hypothetical protein [Sorangium sp. So ce128]|uniref:hypothetical protein n=1 Tax=Sorangium sp. So ce128 TaxID=3133281 RepID=UPI003F621EE7